LVIRNRFAMRKKERPMTTGTLRFAKKNLNASEMSQQCGHGRMDLATVEESTIARMTLEPGWKWSESIRPMVNTDSCQVHHLQYVISGRLHIVQDDGSEMELEPGDFASIPPGHDAWVVGNEPFVSIDFSPDMKQYTQPRSDR
jgi:mannose-6-phosphate isomerase-like protein (cupin superfamily)